MVFVISRLEPGRSAFGMCRSSMQDGIVDCGVFSLQFAQLAGAGQPGGFTFGQADINAMREDLTLAMLQSPNEHIGAEDGSAV